MSGFSPTDPGLRTGLVVRAYSNFCEVLSEGEVFVCRLRGKLKLTGHGILTGDRVTVDAQGTGTGLITSVLPRRSALVRPPIANAELAIIVFTTHSPPLNLELVDRLLILASDSGLSAVLCHNKTDLASEDDIDLVRRTYARSGVPLVLTSAIARQNLDELAGLISGSVAVLAGQSGVGKSTLLNALCPGLSLEVGDLSAKVQRGRHTTRAVKLIPVGQGWVADAPGFIHLDLPVMEPAALQSFYPELQVYAEGCRFQDCLHDPEPDCAVKAAVEREEIDPGRYRRYLGFLHELQARPKY